MKLIDTYNSYKIKYKEYVVLIKSGIFYECLNDDIGIMYSLFHYKIKNKGNNYIVGFPKNSIVKVTDNLKHNKINYIVLEKNNDEYYISDKYKTNKNNNNSYKWDIMKLNYINYKIDSIYSKLKEKIFDKDIEKTLINIERLLWMKNFWLQRKLRKQ